MEFKTDSGRKSPHKHIVHSHIRKYRPVKQYDRGKGKKPIPPTPTISGKPSQSNTFNRSPLLDNFNVTIIFKDGSSENIGNVGTRDSVSALTTGINRIKGLGTPRTIILNRSV